ncbi:MAG: hypothetical protein ILP02_04615, partial [Clostridia bacterium]|nr:hypothetical protein [Clostridia bacterium]
PTGGYIVSNGEIRRAYETGKGRIYIRAKLHIETEGDKKTIVITELPYGVNKAKLLAKIDELTETKKDVFAGIASINDESDRNGMRAVVKLKKDAPAKKILDNLLKYTDLQVSFGINIVVIADGKPQQLGLMDIFRYYTEYQRNIIVRRTRYDLDKAKERAHILEGLIIAVTNIDEVIKIIKNAPDTPTARQKLRERFKLSEKQANAILDLRLARITKLEVNNLKQELSDLKKLIAEYESILESKKKQFQVVENEMLLIKKKYKDDRRSRIVETAEEIDVTSKMEDKKEVETYVVGINVKGRVRKLSPSQYKRILDDDEPIERDIFKSVVKVRSDQLVYAFTNFGNCFKMDVELLPDAKAGLIEGVKFTDLFKEALKSEVPVTLFAVKGIEVPDGKLIFFTRQGMIKLTDWQEYTVQKSVYQAIKLKEGDELFSVEQWQKDKYLFFATKFGMCLKAENEIPEQGRVAGGVKGIVLDDKDEVIEATLIEDDAVDLLGSTFGTFKKVRVFAISPIGRARKGVKIYELGDRKFGEMVICCKVMGDEKIRIKINDRFGTEYFATDMDVEVDSRTTKGKPIKKIGACQPLSAYLSVGNKKQ